MSSIEYKGYKLEEGPGEDGVQVTVRFIVPSIHDAEQLITGCRTLDLRQGPRPAPHTVAPKEEPAPRPKLAAVPDPKPETAPSTNGAKAPPMAKSNPDAAAPTDRGDPITAPEHATKPAEPPAGPKMKLRITEEMRAAKFRGACAELAKQGVNTKSALLRVVPKIKEQVPAFKEVPDDQLEARIAAAVDILGLGA